MEVQLMRKLRIFLRFWLIISSLFYPNVSSSHSVFLNIKGTVVSPPPCTINDDVDIDVNFGNVSINTLNSSDEEGVKIPLSIVCDSSVSKDVILSLVAVSSNFDNDFIGTDIPGLGIELKNDTTLLPPGGEIPITWGHDVILTARVKKDPSEDVVAGDFMASSTLMVSYE